MSLSSRLSLLFALCCGPALLLLWGVADVKLGGALERIQQVVDEGRVQQVYNHLEYHLGDMQRWGELWHRDADALAYVQAPSSDYEDARLRDSNLHFNHVRLMLLFDARQQLVFQRYFPDGSAQHQPLPEPLLRWLQERFLGDGPLARGEGITGISMLDQQPAIFTVHRLQGTPATTLLDAGYIIIAQSIDERMLAQITQATGLEVLLERVVGDRALDSSRGRGAVQGWLTRTLFGLRDGEVFQLAVAADDRLLQSGLEAAQRYVWLATLLVALLALLLFAAVRWLVILPLQSLRRQLQQMKPEQPALTVMSSSGSGEIMELASYVNTLVQRLQLEKSQAQTVLASIADAVVATDLQGRVSYLSPVAERLLGITSSEALGFTIDLLLPRAEEGSSLNAALQRALSGRDIAGRRIIIRVQQGARLLVLEYGVVVIRDSNHSPTALMVLLRDISRAEELRLTLRHGASGDTQTGLPDRQQFEELLVLTAPELVNTDHALCYLELANWQRLSQLCGPLGSEQLLQEIAKLLRRSVRDSDLLARLGPNCFALLLRGLRSQDVLRVVEKLTDELSLLAIPRGASDERLLLFAGVSLFGSGNRSATTMLAEAEAACAAAHTEGRRTVRVFDALTCGPTPLPVGVEAAAEALLAPSRFELWGCRIQSFEAATAVQRFAVSLRLHDEQQGWNSPALLFTTPAQRPQLVQAELLLLEQLLLWLQERRELWLSHQFSVSLSVATLDDPRLLPQLGKWLADSGVVASCLCLELPLTGAHDSRRLQRLTRSLAQLGCVLAVHCSEVDADAWRQLEGASLDYVRLDSQWTRTIHIDPQQFNRVRQFQQQCHQLRLMLLAGDVDSDGSFDCLRQLQLPLLQGNAVAPAKPLHALLPPAAP